MTNLEYLVFVPIAGICLLVGASLKAIRNETLDRFIPTICALCGAALSILAFYTIPDFIPAKNWLDALFVGGGSGFAATGLHQVYKQYTKEDTYDGVFEGEVPNSNFKDDSENEPKDDPEDEPSEEE